MRFRNFWADQGGNTAIIFAFAVAPLIALSGGAVDLAHRTKVRTEMQGAADTAALAAARTIQAAAADNRSSDIKWGKLKKLAEAAGRNAFAATGAGLVRKLGIEPRVKVAKDAVTVSAVADIPTSFLGVIGIDKLRAAALAEVGVPKPVKVEIALVLDYSGSMRENDKYIRMTAAAQAFIAKIGRERGDDTKIGIVPFSEYVYATVRGRDVRGQPANAGNNPMTVCLTNRDYPHSATADPPKNSVDGSRWPAVDPADAQCLKYAPQGVIAYDLTANFAALDAALSQMTPIGNTNIALGAEIGWHMLTSEAPFDQASGSNDTRKILILLTDGVQTVKAMGPSGAVSTLAADETTAQLCQAAKTSEIRIFSIAYDIADARVRNLLAGCASDRESYHEPKEANDISGVFESIFNQIAQSVWLRR